MQEPGSDQPIAPLAALSPVATRLLGRAQREVQAGELAAATRSVAGALALAPDAPEVLRWAGRIAQDGAQYACAVGYFRRALIRLPGDADLHLKLGVALYQLGEVHDGLTELRRACELAPDSASAWYNLAEALKPQAQTRSAIEAFRRALSIDPSSTRASLGLARAQASIGQIDEAAARLRDLLRRDPVNAELWFRLGELKTIALDRVDLHRLKVALEQRNLGPGARIRLEFVLARALEDQGDYAQAFSVLQHANASERQRVKWDANGEHLRVNAIAQVFSSRIADAGDEGLGREALFIASLPRSGSTLVEQILASHPLVEGAGEIKDLGALVDAETRRRGKGFPVWVPEAATQDWRRMGTEYLHRTVRWRARKPRFADKNLLNWVLAGATLAMLPAARIIIVRRDPVETCLGCYRQCFPQSGEFSYDLDEMADFYVDFARLARLWRQKFPDRVFDLEYERLVAEPEPTVRRLLDFLGLPFDPKCLEFYKTPRTVLSAPSAAQVRQPLHNTARAAHYGHLLDGLRARLRAGGIDVPSVD